MAAVAGPGPEQITDKELILPLKAAWMLFPLIDRLHEGRYRQIGTGHTR